VNLKSPVNRQNLDPHDGTAPPAEPAGTSSMPSPHDEANGLAARGHDYTEGDNW